MWARRILQPWRSVALESSRGELERIIYPHWTEWNSCTHQCRSNFRSHASGWPSEACDSHSAKAVFCLSCDFLVVSSPTTWLGFQEEWNTLQHVTGSCQDPSGTLW
jgi:hypothetical protein